VNREWLIGLAGARAVMLEMAHPLIAAGVAQHSNFRGDPLGRLYRTMRPMTDLTFGDAVEARDATRRIHHCHQHINGSAPEANGTHYDANDPHLKFWVLATLIDSVLRVYELFVTPLSPAEKESYYQDSGVMARWLGIPTELVPSTYADFNAYVDAMLVSGTLKVGDNAREIINAIFASPLVGGMARALSFVSIGLLPESLRAAYNLRWDAKREQRMQQFAKFSRRVRPFIPNRVAVHPKAWSAEKMRKYIELSVGRI
jgi:uncharacterized protein (DUF2236 family)